MWEFPKIIGPMIDPIPQEIYQGPGGLDKVVFGVCAGSYNTGRKLAYSRNGPSVFAVATGYSCTRMLQ